MQDKTSDDEPLDPSAHPSHQISSPLLRSAAQSSPVSLSSLAKKTRSGAGGGGGGGVIMRIPKDKAYPYHFPQRRKPAHVRISLGVGWGWSGAFSLSEIGNLTVNIAPITETSLMKTELIGVEIQLKGATFWIQFSDVGVDQVPFFFPNNLFHKFTLC